jgi:hypothetical protein
MNPLEPALDNLFERLNFYNFLITYIDKRLTNLKSDIERRAGKSEKVGVEDLMHGTSLIITDLSGPTDGGWLYQYSTGNFDVEGEDYLQMLNEFVGREAERVVAQGYEAFETYLYDVTARFCDAKSEQSLVDHFKGNLPKAPERDLEAWKKAVRGVYRRKPNSDLVDLLRDLGQGLDEAEVHTNNRGLDLVRWYQITGEVRHAVTHSEGVISSKVIEGFDRKEIRVLRKNYPGAKTDEGYALQLDVDSAQQALRTFAEYGYSIFKALSEERGYDWVYLPGQDERAT